MFVMAGLVPAIHVFFVVSKRKTWMPGTSPGMTEQNIPNSPLGFPVPFYMIFIMST
jgi:hypothetical protein